MSKGSTRRAFNEAAFRSWDGLLRESERRRRREWWIVMGVHLAAIAVVAWLLNVAP